MLHPVFCVFSLFSAHSSKKGEHNIATCKICANQAVKVSTEHQVFTYTCGEEGIVISLLKIPDWNNLFWLISHLLIFRVVYIQVTFWETWSVKGHLISHKDVHGGHQDSQWNTETSRNSLQSNPMYSSIHCIQAGWISLLSIVIRGKWHLERLKKIK